LRLSDLSSDVPTCLAEDQTFVPVNLPSVDRNNLKEIELRFTKLNVKKSRLGGTLIMGSPNYIELLLQLFDESEDLEDVESLHRLYSIFKSISKYPFSREDRVYTLQAIDWSLCLIPQFRSPIKQHGAVPVYFPGGRHSACDRNFGM
jgi:hypothetical protein